MSAIVFEGINPYVSGEVDKENLISGHDYCGNPVSHVRSSSCSSMIDSEKLHEDYNRTCYQQKGCDLVMKDYLPAGP